MRHFLFLLLWLMLPLSALAQASETAIVKQAVQLEQETPADTRIAELYDQLKASPKDPQVHVKLGEVYFCLLYTSPSPRDS